MNEQSRKQAERDALAAQRYERYQREIRSGRRNGRDGPRPREFDANGFPIPQRNPTFLERVARLLSPL